MVAIPSLLLGTAVVQSIGPLVQPLEQAAKAHKSVTSNDAAQNATGSISPVNTTGVDFDTVAGPVVPSNFPDPAIIQVGDIYYAFATSNKWSSDGIHIQVATSTDYSNWTLTGQDALPQPGAWSDGNRVWAPDVVQIDDGSFVMYYSAEVAANHNLHCVGAATSKTIVGPYTAVNSPLACPLDKGGAIDPDGFLDPSTNKRYVVYKVDGNSIGHGGSCNNGVEPIVPTPIMLQELQPNGVDPTAAPPVQVLDRDQYDGPLIEAPSLHRSDEGIYFLFYSSNCFVGPLYDTGYATATSITGPYTKSQRPLLVTGDGPNLLAPGGTDIMLGGEKLVFHSDMRGVKTGNGGHPQERAAQPLIRGMWTAEPKFSGRTVSI